MNLHEELKEYIFDPGLVCQFKLTNDTQRHPKTASEDPSGNGLLYTSLAIIVARDNGEDVKEWTSEFGRSINECSIDLGLVKRTPRKPDQNSVDDYTAIAAFHDAVASHICWYGESKKGKIWGVPVIKYCFNTEQPGEFSFKAWLGRMPQLVAHFQACARYPVSWMYAKYWAMIVNKAAGSDPNNQDAWLLTWLLHRHPPKYDFCVDAAKNWRTNTLNRFGKEWCQGIAARVLEAGHPIGKKFIF